MRNTLDALENLKKNCFQRPSPFFSETVSLGSFGPVIPAQTTDPAASASQVPGLKVCAPMSSLSQSFRMEKEVPGIERWPSS